MGIFYVGEKALDTCKEKIKKGEDITQDMLNDLAIPKKLADDEMMVPVDMRGVGAEYDDVEQMAEKLGPKGAVEAFIKAREYFEANNDEEPEDERPKPMTAAEWKLVLQDDLDEGEEEDLLEDDEEELEEDLDSEGDAE